MSEERSRLIVHGSPASQPSRAVYWTCLIKGLPIELRPPDFADLGRSDLADLNPKLQVPTIVDGDFALYEMPAILIYLCEKHGWDDLYPSDLETRARVHQYLHFHHTSTRLATLKLMAPHVTIAFREMLESRGGLRDVMQADALQAALREPNVLESGHNIVASVACMIEASYLRDSAAFLCGGSASIADIACYEELAQLVWAGLFDFAGFPKLQRWLGEMTRLPFHEEAHRYNVALGDIVVEPNTMKRFLEASAVGQAALEGVGVRMGR